MKKHEFSLTNHIMISSCNEIAKIMLPLLQKHAITNFAYCKVKSDRSFFHLCSHLEWSKNFFKKGYFNKISAPIKSQEPHPVFQTKDTCYLAKRKINYFLWLTKECPEIFIDAQVNFDIGNGITISDRDRESIEYFHFSTTPNNASIINNFYLNNLDLLRSYGLIFKEQFKSLIKQAENDKIVLLDTTGGEKKLSPTKRQYECAELLLKGMTYKEIGEYLNLSPRTIETHIDYLKAKFGCHNKRELLFKLLTSFDSNR